MEGFILVDGPNVLLDGLRVADTGNIRVKSGLTALAKKILDTQNFDDWGLEIFCDCPKTRRTEEKIEYKQSFFRLVFCPKKNGGADKFILDRAVLINKGKNRQIIVTNDKDLREDIWLATEIEKSSLIELVYVKDFMEEIKNSKKPNS